MYYIIEIQEQQDGTGTIVTPIKTSENTNDAFSKYHGTLTFAAISNVYRHTVMILDGSGQYLARETYTHVPVEPELEGGEEE